MYVLADGEGPLREGERSLGDYVTDDAVSVPANAYVTFSTVYNGKRYYLGVDTVAARSGKDTVAWYIGPNYAAMWIAGPLWSPTGQKLDNKDYTRTIKSVWLKEKVGRDRYLTVGAETGSYKSLLLRADSVMWHTAKDSREQNRYINGYLYYYSIENGLDVYRYLSFDLVYGFSRLYEAKSQASQRISVWDRTTGSDLIYHMTPNSITFGYNPTHDTIPITSQVYYYADVDRFRSRMDQVDVYARRSVPIIDQEKLVNDYGLEGHWEWKSNPINEAHPELYDGNSLMPYYTIVSYDLSDPSHPVPVWGWRDSAVVHVRQTGFNLVDNVWYDTIYAGVSPIDEPNEARFLRKPANGSAPEEGDYVNQNDWLYVHFKCAGREYRDSVYVVRQTFHQENYTTLELDPDPEDDVFPYSYNNKGYDGETPITSSDTARTFTISALYTSGYRVRAASGNVVFSHEGTRQTLNLLDRSSYNDGGVLYDTLLVEALNVDGTPCDWIESVRLTARNQIRVKVSQYNPSAPANRTAQIRFMYRYRNVVDENDRAEAVRVIWISQEWSGAHATEPYIYSFTHKDTEADGLQAVHEKKNTIYAIPGENLSLPLHRDHWGYYRWFIYDEGIKKDRDLEYMSTWSYATGKVPENALGNDFMLINHSAAASSRGRWDVIRDVNNSGNPDFAQDHFVQWTQTPIPELRYPENEAASLTKSGKIACDVSEYYDVETTGRIGELTAMTEPTLSYRQIFDIQPAKIRADQMANVKGNGSGANWLEQHSVVAPAGRAFSLQPQCPIAYQGDQEIDEEHLQYIYYANPVTENAGTRTGLTDEDLQKNRYYARIGVKKRVNTYKKLTLITYADLMALGNNGSISDIVLVNPRKTTGLIVGNNNEQAPWYMDYRPYRATKTQLEDDLAAKLNDGGGYAQAYLTVQRNGTSNEFFFKRGNYTLYDLYTVIDIGGGTWREYNVRWYRNNPTGSQYFTLGSYAGSLSDANLPSGYSSGDLLTFYSNWEEYIVFVKKSNKGYLKGEYPIYCEDVSEASSRNPYYGWLIYKVETVSTHDFEEIPCWETSANGTDWTQVAIWDYETNTATCAPGYTMTADGALHIEAGVHTTVNAPIFYRLRTEHFQIAKFQGLTRSADTEMLKLGGDIISEEDIERDYDILYNLDMETWPAPGTNNVVAYNKPFPWDFTELSYHYPLSAIPAENRVFTTEMPGKGEYAFINKFVVPSGPTTSNPGEVFECMAGAEHGYMLCVNAAGKRTTIMNFDFNQMTCSNQQIYLVGNYCNPVDNSYEPEITADMEGSNDGGVTWTRIYRYKSGKIPYRESSGAHWHQMALPISRDSIAKYEKFRCRAEISGGSQRNAHLLIDRLRFIEKDRAFSVFQNKATCIKEDSVTALIRINYQASPELYQPGKLIAYQFQKWDKTANSGAGGYVPLDASLDNGDGSYTAYALNDPRLEIYPGYLKDGFTAKEGVEEPSLKSLKGHDYGYVLIPEASYDPSASNTVSGQSALRGTLIDQALTKLNITGSAAETRKAAFLDETANIRTFDQVVAQDYNDFVTVSFGGVETPHIKSFVNVDGTWLLYIVCRLPVKETDNNTFRIGMTVMNNINDHPTFTEESCATFRILKVKQTTSLLLDGEAWPNYTRTQIEADPSDEKVLLPANETYRASIQLTVKDVVGTYPTYNPRCKFDLLHADGDVRSSDAAFLAKYGCTRTQFVDDMEAFRIDDERNVLRDITDWHGVTPEMFTRTGRAPDVANGIYNRLNHLINDLHVLELGLDYRDIYMGDKADSWFYLLPIPATGLYDVNRHTTSELEDTTMNASVCNDTLWLELHSIAPEAKLRFGYDSRVGDTYIVPMIRATRSEANGLDGKHLNVRVAESWTASDAYKIILGWDSTQLIDSNDPAWTGMQTFKYCQDIDMRGHMPSETSYYSKDDVIHFTPQPSGNTIALKAGYWYQFKTAFNAVSKSETYAADPAVSTGHSQFILSIAPDTARWTPTHADEANYWNDDDNWTAVVNGEDAPDALTKVPMGDTRVIIPQVDEGLLPIVADLVVERMDTLHYGYAKNTCKEILFKPRSQMLGQERLEYQKAFVDVLFSSGTWQTFSPALEHIYSGDMYIPSAYDGSAATAASTDTRDFDNQAFPKDGEYVGSYNPRLWPYAFYQGFYNASVPVAYYNTDLDNLPVATTTAKSKNSVDWVKTNTLDMPYNPGAACIITGYGMGDDGEELVVRLPKKESSYYGYGKLNGSYRAGEAVPVSRPAYAELEHNLAYDKFSLDGSDGIEYTLHNATASNIFFFGNPTMALIDVYKLCEDNADKLVAGKVSDSYLFTAYQLIEGTNYNVKDITGPGQYFVEPQRAVGLIAKEAGTSLRVKLTPKAMVAIIGEEGTIISHDDIKGDGSKKRMVKAATSPQQRSYLYIAASNETTDAWDGKSVSKAYLTLGEEANAHRGFHKGEDALSIASGLNYYSDESFSTPLSMYTIADNKALMQDIRDTLQSVPLVFATLDSQYTFSSLTMLSFATEGDWNTNLYLYDALTGDSVRIVNGLQVAVETPQSDQIRYFINGAARVKPETPENPGVATGNEHVTPNEDPADNGQAVIYDMLGRKIMTLHEYDLISNTALPTGVYIIQRGTQTERMVIR
jgi:hypothetical protein